MYAWNDGTTYSSTKNNYLAHHGIKNQKWGVRRFQYEDGTLTPEGIIRYRKSVEKNKRKQITRGVGSVLSGAGSAGVAAAGAKALSIVNLASTSMFEFGKIAYAQGSIAAAQQYLNTMALVSSVAPYAAIGMAALGASLAVGSAVAGAKKRKAKSELELNELKKSS